MGMGRAALALLAVSFVVSDLRAAEPTVRNLDLRGVQIGGTTTLTFDGDDLGPNPRLLLPFPAKQTLKPGATDKRIAFELTPAADVPPGYYPLWVVTDRGASVPVVVGVDRLPQMPVAATVKELPVALHGTVGGSTVAETTFPGKAGQKVLVEVEAQRLGSKLRPVIHLYSPKRLQITWAWPTPALHGDARLEATLPEDGTYTVTHHDAEYAVPGSGFYRLKLGQWSCVDQVFPPVVGKGATPQVELLGTTTAKATLAATSSIGSLPLDWPKEGVWSGPRPFVQVSPYPELVEQAAGEMGQDLPAGPVGVSGRLLQPYEEDGYRVPVTPGTKVRLEVFAERYGSPLDVALVVRNEKGADLARAEDSPGTVDPMLEFAVPDKVTTVAVAVVDALGRGGSRGVYRLTVDPQTATGGAVFALTTPTQRLAIPVGGRAVVPILAERRGYPGGVEIVANLPPGMTLAPVAIPNEADGALVTIQRGDAPSEAAITRWRGRGTDGVERPVLLKGHPLKKLQPWLAADFVIAPTTTKAADFQLDWRNLPTDAGLVPAGKLSLPVKITRADEKSPVKLTLLTSQRPILVNNQPDPNQSLRLEKAVELGAKMSDGDPTLLVPPQLAAPMYDVTVQADLLSPDKKAVLATAYAPVRRMAVRLPVVVKLDGPPRIEAALDAKKETTVKVAGQVERREGLKGDVVVTLAGLPPGARADTPTVKGDATAFSVSVVLPPTAAAGEIKGLKLFGTAAPDSKQPNVRVRSRDVDLTLVVKAAAK